MPLGLLTCCNMNYVLLVSIKWLYSVPRGCVLPEDIVSGLTMQGKPVALSRGATTILFELEKMAFFDNCILVQKNVHLVLSISFGW